MQGGAERARARDALVAHLQWVQNFNICIINTCTDHALVVAPGVVLAEGGRVPQEGEEEGGQLGRGAGQRVYRGVRRQCCNTPRL